MWQITANRREKKKRTKWIDQEKTHARQVKNANNDFVFCSILEINPVIWMKPMRWQCCSIGFRLSANVKIQQLKRQSLCGRYFALNFCFYSFGCRLSFSLAICNCSKFDCRMACSFTDEIKQAKNDWNQLTASKLISGKMWSQFFSYFEDNFDCPNEFIFSVAPMDALQISKTGFLLLFCFLQLRRWNFQ